jgi:hypothetical protein
VVVVVLGCSSNHFSTLLAQDGAMWAASHTVIRWFFTLSPNKITSSPFLIGLPSITHKLSLVDWCNCLIIPNVNFYSPDVVHWYVEG